MPSRPISLSQELSRIAIASMVAVTAFVHCHASNLGIPELKNFRVEDYSGAPQNWDIAQAPGGQLYFANNKGLIVYDGVSWATHPLPKKTILRSIELWQDDKILSGGQSELGYFQISDEGIYSYTSLLELIPEEDRLFEDVWDMLLLEKDGFAFSSSGKVFCYQDSSFSVFDVGAPIVQLAAVNGEMFAQLEKTGEVVRITTAGNVQPFAGNFAFPSEIVSVLPHHQSGFLIFTIRDGIFHVNGTEVNQWKEKYLEFFSDSRISDAIQMSDGRIAVGTTLGGGLVILDQDGNAHYRIDRKSGLQSNSVYKVFEDAMGDIWLGLDNGIDLVALSSPVKRFFPDGESAGTGYAVKIFEDYIYFGSNHGLYRIPWKNYYDPIAGNDRFEKVAGTEGQVWSLTEQGGKLLMGHHEGAFLIENDRARKVMDGGAWEFVSLPPDALDDRLAVGTYTGLSLFGRDGQAANWKFLDQLDAPEESSRIIISDKRGWVWVTHPYRGVWRCSFEGDQISEVVHYGEQNGFPSDNGIYAFDLGAEIVFCAEKGIFRYDPKQDRFELHDEFTTHFGSESWIQKLVTDPDGDMWFVENDRVGILRVDESSLSKKVEKTDFEMLNGQLVGGHELIYPTADGDVFFATSKGFLQYREEWLSKRLKPFKVMLLGANARDKKDSLVSTRVVLKEGEQAVYPAGTSVFQFRFSDNQYSGMVPSMYQFYLEGSDAGWGEWTERTQKEYNNLRPGSYKFHLRSRDDLLKVSDAVVYSFRVHAPWYLSNFAYFIYVVALIAALFGLVVIPRKKYEKDKKKLQVQQQRTLHEQQLRHQKEEEAKERQIVELKNEKLKAELDHQNQELASATMHLVQKNSLIAKVKDDLAKITKLEDVSEMSKITRQLLGILNRDAMLDDEWEQFSMQFDKVHHDFLGRLKEKFPQLSPKDLKLCAFLKMNLTTKEIAPLLNISVRGVEISRYRLRKKLQLASEVNLVEYMMEI